MIIFSIFFFLSNLWGGDFSHVDPERLINPKLLDSALSFYQKNLTLIKNKRFLGIIDFTFHNSRERFYIVNLQSGFVEKYLVAHGKNTDPNNDGYADFFSNVIDSNMSSLGFFITAETYRGQFGYSLRLDGLSNSNSNARKRAIVIHSASYVTPGRKIGRSNGCPSIENRFHQEIIDNLKGGALLYAEKL